MKGFFEKRRDQRRRGRRPAHVLQTVRLLALAGIVLIVGGTALVLKSWAFPSASFGLGSYPAKAITLYVQEVRISPRHAPGASYPSGELLNLVFEADFSTKYLRMDASPTDAKFAVFAPSAHDCCWLARRLTFRNDAVGAEIALPIVLVPGAPPGSPDITIGDLGALPISEEEAAALHPGVLARQPMIATVDVGNPASPRLFDLSPATDVDIAAHARARTLAAR